MGSLADVARMHGHPRLSTSGASRHLLLASLDRLVLLVTRRPAVPLARALIHTKVPGWMDEEMPQAAPRSANAQRFRCGCQLIWGHS